MLLHTRLLLLLLREDAISSRCSFPHSAYSESVSWSAQFYEFKWETVP